MARLLTLANLALEVGGLLMAGRGEKRSSPILLLKYGITVLGAVMTGILGLTFLTIAVIYWIWPEADVVTVFACLGGIFSIGCLGLAGYLGTMKRPFKEDPKPILPEDPSKLMDAFFRGLNSKT